MNTELQSLQNMASGTGLTIYERFSDDKRKTVKMYFANNGTETVSPTLEYMKLNYFLLGWIKASEALNN